jgi:hypothetical protein
MAVNAGIFLIRFSGSDSARDDWGSLNHHQARQTQYARQAANGSRTI